MESKTSLGVEENALSNAGLSLFLYGRIKNKNIALTLESVHKKLDAILKENDAQAQEDRFLSPKEKEDITVLIREIGCYAEIASYTKKDGTTFKQFNFQQFYQANKELCEKSMVPLARAKEDYLLEF